MSAAVDDPHTMRRAGRELLSLALIDSRNQLLRLLALDECGPALRLAAAAAHYQEYWIARHVQRQRGEACDPQAPRLAGIEPHAEDWLRDDGELPTPEALRRYLHDTLELTLDLLATTPAQADGAALHFYRLALLHEDRLGEALAERLRIGAPPARAARAPIALPAQRWRLGGAAEPGALLPHNERGSEEVALPEFEIDAQVVNWAQYVEFAEDRAYDRPELWSPEGWDWLQRQGRRAPAHVEQLLGGVLVLRDGGMQRAVPAQPVLHVSRYEAEAWCRWAGRRLPTEAEWELAASTAARRGFVWGEVFEWVSGSACAWPGAGTPTPGALDAIPPPDAQGRPQAVLRGASFATRARWRHPKARRFAPAARDTMFCGFRSCSL